MKLNGKMIGGVVILLAALYYWLVARNFWLVSHAADPPSFYVVYLFTFRLFRFADVLWTIAGATLLYRGIQEARAA